MKKILIKRHFDEVNVPEKKKDFLMIGCGNMGMPILQAVYGEFGNDAKITVVNPSKRSLPDQVEYYSSIEELSLGKKFDVALLSIKPQMASKVLPLYKNFMKDNAIILSIMAGVSVETIQGYFQENTKVVRTMPNLCANINQSVTGVAANNNLSDEESEFVKRFVKSFGEIVLVNEDKINSITAVSGSGPAYVFHIMDLMVKAIAENLKVIKDGQKIEQNQIKNLVIDAIITRFEALNHGDFAEMRHCTKFIDEKGSLDELITNTIKSAGAKIDHNQSSMLIKGIILEASKAFIAAAENVGFNQESSAKLVHKTILGSAKLAKQSNKSLFELRENVTSKGGTTEAGLQILMSPGKSNMFEIFQSTVEFALMRADTMNVPTVSFSPSRINVHQALNSKPQAHLR